MTADRQVFQQVQYGFPYHHLPHFQPDGTPARQRAVRWGLEYLCYHKHVAELVKLRAPKSVIEVGCGDGRFIGELDVAGCKRVGVDMSAPAIAFARAFYPDVEFVVGDAAEVRRGERFDTVACIEVLEHIPDDAETLFLRSLFGLVAPGGAIVLTVPTTNIPLNKKHFRHYSRDTLTAAFARTGVPHRVESMEYVVDGAGWVQWYERLTANRHWFIDLSWLNRLAWRRLWRDRHASDARGLHLVAVVVPGDRSA